MSRITAATSLSQLAILCRQYGVTRLVILHETGDAGEPCKALLVTPDHAVIGTSTAKSVNAPEIDALDDAFARLKHLLAADIGIEGAATGASAKWSL